MRDYSHALARLLGGILIAAAALLPARAQMLSSGNYYDQDNLSFVTSQSDDDGTATSITISSSAQAGDIAVIANFAYNTDSGTAPTQVIPDGWIDAAAATGTWGVGTAGMRGQLLLKVLEEEDISASFTMMDDNAEFYQAVYFRGNGVAGIKLNPGGIVGAVTNGDADQVCDDADLTAQTFNSAGDVRPLLGIAASWAAGSTANVTSDIGFTGEITGGASDVELGYVLWDQDDSDATHTMDATSGSAFVPACLMSQLIFQSSKQITPNRVASMSGTVAASGTESENYPTGTVADDLVILLTTHDTDVVTVNDAGWTTITSDGAAEPAYAIHWKIAGTETSVSLTGAATSPTAVQMISYRGTDLVAPIENGTAAAGGSGDPDPPDLNPTDGTFAETIFLAIGFVDDDNVTTIDCPSGFGRGVFSAAGGAGGATASVVSCERRRSTATSLNPGIIVNSGDDQVIGQTMAIRGR